MSKTTLRVLFSIILISMLAVTSWASAVQPVWEWQALVRAPDNAWTIATLADAYAGFITFYVWVYARERNPWQRGGWLIAVLLLGNMAMASYWLIALNRLEPEQPLSDVFKVSHD